MSSQPTLAPIVRIAQGGWWNMIILAGHTGQSQTNMENIAWFVQFNVIKNGFQNEFCAPKWVLCPIQCKQKWVPISLGSQNEFCARTKFSMSSQPTLAPIVRIAQGGWWIIIIWVGLVLHIYIYIHMGQSHIYTYGPKPGGGVYLWGPKMSSAPARNLACPASPH